MKAGEIMIQPSLILPSGIAVDEAFSAIAGSTGDFAVILESGGIYKGVVTLKSLAPGMLSARDRKKLALEYEEPNITCLSPADMVESLTGGCWTVARA
ncbi:hypothetical protein IT084_07365 [Desulfallas sp. Bu1-1]|uniref:hypothetical protein n=1 Tax=Desulfallas sp. Bu1-1 TaxID=2787620 RepID=UPI00189DDCEA|nr:hypothetical protein [Desulfallas sp. Bu1-1]MBF7082797.1 hypothetical protein [Desulfallas sp. Bu1-1]